MYLLLLLIFAYIFECSECVDKKYCVNDNTKRFDCLPDISSNNKFKLNTVQRKCLQRNCCFDENVDVNVPHCFYPLNYTNYATVSEIHSSGGIELRLQCLSPIQIWPPNQSKQLKVNIDYINPFVVRVNIQSLEENVFTSDEILENPLPVDGRLSPNNLDYSVVYSEQHFSISLIRKSTNISIFDTSVSSLIYAQRFKQITSVLGTNNSCVYGLAEHNTALCITTRKRLVYTFFNRGDQPEERNDPQFNLYGHHPLYMAIEDDGSAHGVYLHNSHALDVVLQPGSTITYRTIGGNLDFFFIFGPKPDDVTSQYTSIVGKPLLPPFWALGFHLCRYDYNSTKSIRNVWKRTIDAGIPFDAQWSDVDYMENRKDFTFDPINYKGLPQFVHDVHSADMKYVINISPGLSQMEPKGTYAPYEIAAREKLFVMDPKKNAPLVGKCWQNETVWLDFSNPKTIDYWIQQLKIFHTKLPFDALWLDMNEPYNFRSLKEMSCDIKDPLMRIPYSPGHEPISNSTLCMYVKHFKGSHFDMHTLYSLYESKASSKALRVIRKGKRPWIMSRATAAGQGRYSSHWNGDITAEWATMRRTISNMLIFNIIGMPFVGADICGFMMNTTESLCLRWHQLGAFYTFSRNHNDFNTIDHDPVSMGPRVTKAAKNALELRYSLLPYLYTLFYKAHIFGTTVARPLFYEFPNDKKTHALDKQFMWGKAIMFNPALHEGEDVVNTYFPKGQWFSNFKDEIIGPATIAVKTSLETPNINFRAGNIIVTQNAANNTVNSRKNPFNLIVYLDKESNTSNGELYWDDGESEPLRYTRVAFEAIKLIAKEESYRLLINPIVVRYNKDEMILKQITVLGVNRKPRKVVSNSRRLNIKECVKLENNTLYISLNNVTVTLLKKNVIFWTF